MTRSRGRPTVTRLTVPAVALAVVVTAGCQAADPRAAPATGASVVDGIWNAHIVWADTPPAGCPLTGDGEVWANYRMTLSRGVLTIVESGDAAPEPVVGATSHYKVFRDRIEMDDGTTARFERDGDTLTFSDVQGGGCDGRTVMSTVPWRLVDG